MFLALVYLLLRRVVGWVACSSNEQMNTEVELVVPRHQLKVLKRQVGRPQLRRRDLWGSKPALRWVACCPPWLTHSSESSSSSGDAAVSTTTVWSSNEHHALSIFSDRSRGHSAGSMYHPFSSSSNSAW